MAICSMTIARRAPGLGWQALLFLAAGVAAQASDGGLDPRFGSGGKATVALPAGVTGGMASGVAVQADGKVLLLGTFSASPVTHVVVVRLLANGLPDLAFGEQGVVTAYSTTNAWFPTGIVVQEDGGIVIAGSLPVLDPNILLVRILPTGIVDAEFGERFYDIPVIEDELASALVLGPGNTLLLGSIGARDGSFGGLIAFGITRLLADGTPDETYGPTGTRIREWRETPDPEDISRVYAIAPLADGSLLISGNLENSTLGSDLTAVGRLDPSGNFDPSFGGTGRRFIDWSATFFPTSYHHGIGVAAVAENKVLVLSQYIRQDLGHQGEYRFGTARFDSKGNLDLSYGASGRTWAAFEVGTFNNAFGMVVDRTDRPVIVGEYCCGGGNHWLGAMRLTPGGAGDGRFHGDGNQVWAFCNPAGLQADAARAVALQPDGGILVVGSSCTLDGQGQVASTLAVLRLGGGLPFGDAFESGTTGFWY